ncbi:hypothetical protein U9M48_032935 [Paspalum notatum var. saurae]|uniref:Uncharacterized protein n=1 Tax=Paspalum notatum var. saurae TaxID=547442 RepID=A0AAQ3U6B3_PASNO
MAAPSHPYTPPHHRNMKTECSHHKEDDPLLCSSIHALKHGMEVVSLLLPLLSMVWRPWRAPPTIPNAKARLQPYGILFALRIDVCQQQQEYFEEGKYNVNTT